MVYTTTNSSIKNYADIENEIDDHSNEFYLDDYAWIVEGFKKVIIMIRTNIFQNKREVLFYHK